MTKNTRNQAEEIREETVKMLKNTHGKEEYYIDENLYGIRFSDLKKKLLDTNKFTEGAVIGALNTMTDRVELIDKIKHQGKSFFYYNSGENRIEKKPVYITESKDFEDLTDGSQLTQQIIEKILNKSGKNIYKEISDTDRKNLRTILEKTNELNESIRNYKQEKSFEVLSTNSIDTLPF